MNRPLHIGLLLLIFTVILPRIGWGQDDPYDIVRYPFVHLDKNKLLFFDDSSSFENLFHLFDVLLFQGKGEINIVHFGGSHIQADVWSNQMRQRLQTFHPGNKGSRGLIFPFRVAKTNGPSNLSINYTGTWKRCRSVTKTSDCTLGLTGISVATEDSVSKIEILLKNEGYLAYDFNKVKIFYNTMNPGYQIDVLNVGINNIVSDSINGYTEFTFDRYLTKLEVRFTKTDSCATKFELFGIEFENEDPGITYHGIGVNGASVPSYLRCSLLANHLKVIEPDLVIFSIGINDASESDFSTKRFIAHYDSLIARIKSVAPNVAILFTTNNDSYKRRRYLNKNGEIVKKAMYELAKKHKCGVWDLFTIMGGLNSIVLWQRYGLAKRDKVHFTTEGYVLVGNLMFNAMLRSYGNHIKKLNIKNE